MVLRYTRLPRHHILLAILDISLRDRNGISYVLNVVRIVDVSTGIGSLYDITLRLQPCETWRTQIPVWRENCVESPMRIALFLQLLLRHSNRIIVTTSCWRQ
jgi:hypothetical protein